MIMQCLCGATSLSNVTTYFLLHVSLQHRIAGDLLIFLQRFAKTSKVKNLITKARKAEAASDNSTVGISKSIVNSRVN